MKNKDQLRKLYKSKRKELTTREIDEFSNIIFNQFLASKFVTCSTFHIFLSIEKQKEVKTNQIINYLLSSNKKVIIPKVEDEDLKHYLITHETIFKPNKWNILEPVDAQEFTLLNEIDIAFIPLLINDKSGNRIGYGKGFYDKFLNKLNSNSLKIGLNYFESIDCINAEPHDIPLDYLISPFKIESFLANLTK